MRAKPLVYTVCAFEYLDGHTSFNIVEGEESFSPFPTPEELGAKAMSLTLEPIRVKGLALSFRFEETEEVFSFYGMKPIRRRPLSREERDQFWEGHRTPR